MEEKGYGGKPMVTHLFTQIEICLIEVAVIAIDQQGRAVRMEMLSFQDLLLFGTFLITLLAYIDRNNKRK